MYEVKLDLNASLEDAKRPTVVVCSSEVHKLPGLISLLKHRSGLAVRLNFKSIKERLVNSLINVANNINHRCWQSGSMARRC